MPDIPEDSALLKMEVAGICGTDVKLYKMPPSAPPGIMGPQTVGYGSSVVIQGPGQQGLSQTVICKQAGASLIIVAGTSKDAARLEVARQMGADHVIDVDQEDPLARIMEIPGGKGVDVVLDCTAGAGTIPILLGVEAAKRKGATLVMQGEMPEFPNFPIGRVTGRFMTLKRARGHSYLACELALQQLASKRFPLE